jgi:hypothetical protein
MRLFLLAVLLTLSGCTDPYTKKFSDVDYVWNLFSAESCCDVGVPGFGVWGCHKPGWICFTDRWSLEHEECHEEAYRLGMSRRDNWIYCGHKPEEFEFIVEWEKNHKTPYNASGESLDH